MQIPMLHMSKEEYYAGDEYMRVITCITLLDKGRGLMVFEEEGQVIVMPILRLI